jgi:hypothetical protein
MTIDSHNSLSSHSYIKAATNDSNNSLESLFKDLTSLDKDFINMNSSLNSKPYKRVLIIEIKDIYRLKAG